MIILFKHWHERCPKTLGRIVFILGGLLFPLLLVAQGVTSYAPLVSPQAVRDQVKAEFVAANNIQVAAISDQDVKAFYEERHELLLTRLKREDYLFDASIHAYLNGLLERIVSVNPEFDDRPLRLWVRRSAAPNAACYGEGTIEFNLGLLRWLENESQIAFVLCHELAHYHLDHVNADFMRKLNYRRSDEFKKKVKKIKKAEYNQLEMLEALMQESWFSSSKHSRSHESEADSMALVFLKRTDFDPNEALSLLAILDNCDGERHEGEIPFEQTFSYEDQPFDPYWMEEESGMGFKQKVDEALADSLKTHPDCQKRIADLSHQFSLQESVSPGHPTVKGIALVSDFEIVESLLDRKSYGNALFFSLQLQKTQPNNAYLHAVQAICLSRLYWAQEAHEFSRYVQLPEETQWKNYRKTLQFLHNLRLRELKTLALAHTKVGWTKYAGDEHMLYARYLAAKLEEKDELVEVIRDKYKTDFPKGRYLTQINR